jgi:voltage-dependent anion channel protein 2
MMLYFIFPFCIYSAKTGKLKTTYKHENVSATADFDLSLSTGPLIYASAVVGYQGKFK